MAYHIRCQSLDRNPERGYRSHVTATSSSFASNASSTDGLDGWMSDSGGDDNVTTAAWRRSGGSTDKGGRILRKSGLTTSRSGELMLSDAEDTIKRMTLERRHKDQVLHQTADINSNLTSKTAGGSGGSNAQLADDGKVVQPAGPILTVNSVSNPAAASRTLRSLSPASSRRAAAQATAAAASGRRLSSASDGRHGRGRIDDVEQFDWSATLNLLSHLDNNGGTSNGVREERRSGSGLGHTTVETRRTTRRDDWESSTLQPPSNAVSTRTAAADSRSEVPARGVGRTASSFSGGISGQRGYASDSEESSDWLERQRSRVRMKIQPRTDAERRLIAELKASQEKLNLVGTGAEPTDGRRLPNGNSNDTSNGFFQSSSTTFRSTTSTRPQNAVCYGLGRSSTLPLNREHRASSELDFTERKGRYYEDEDLGGGLKVNGVGTRSAADSGNLDRHRSTSALDRAEIIEDRLYRTAVNYKSNASSASREPPNDRRRQPLQQPMQTLDVPQLKRSATLPHRLYRSQQLLDSGSSAADYGTEQRSRSRFDFSTNAIQSTRTGSSLLLGPPLVNVSRPVVNNDEEIHLEPIGPGYQTLEQPDASTVTRLSNINLAADRPAVFKMPPTISSSRGDGNIPWALGPPPSRFSQPLKPPPLTPDDLLYIDEDSLLSTTEYSPRSSSVDSSSMSLPSMSDSTQPLTTRSSVSDFQLQSSVPGDNEPSSFSTLPKPPRTQLYADQFYSSTTSFQPPIQASQTVFSTQTRQHQQLLGPAVQLTAYGSSGALNGYQQTAPTSFNAVGSSSTLPTGRLGGHRRTQSSVGTSYESSTFQKAGGMTLNGGKTMNGGVWNGQPAAASTFQEGNYDRLDIGRQYQQQQQQQQQQQTGSQQVSQLHPMTMTQTLPLNGHRRSNSTGFGEQFQSETSSWNGVGWTTQPQQPQQQQRTVITVHQNANYEPLTTDSRQQVAGMNGVANWNQSPAASTTFRQTTVQQEYHVKDQKQYLQQQQMRLQQEQTMRQQEQQLLQQRMMEEKAKGDEIRRQQQLLKQQEEELIRMQEIQRLQEEMRREEQERVRLQEEEMRRQEMVRQEMLRQQDMQRQQEEMRRQEIARQETLRRQEEEYIRQQQLIQQQEVLRQQEFQRQQQQQQEEIRRQEIARQEMQRKQEIQREEMQRQQQMTFERQNQEEMMRIQQQQWQQQQQQKQKLILPQTDHHVRQQQQFVTTMTTSQQVVSPQSTISSTLNGDEFHLEQAANEARAADVSRLITRSAVGSVSGSAAAGGATVQPSTVLQCQTVGPSACGLVSSFQTASNSRAVLISPDDYTIKQFPADARGLREPMPGETGRRYTGAAESVFEQRYETGSWQNQQSPSLAGAGAMTFQRISGASSGTERSSAELGTISSIDSSVFLDGSIEPPDLQRLSIKFVKDTSNAWYKPDLTRDEVVVLLRDSPPGSFIVRNSNSFPGAFALAVRISQLTPSMQAKGDPADGLVRHFLVESTAKGVRLRGHKNEPVFGSLAALIYQHTLTAISLPCKLLMPAAESSGMVGMSAVGGSSSPAVPGKEAACLVVYVNTVDVESLTGPEAIDRAIKVTLDRKAGPGVTTTLAHFKLSAQGITLTDNRHRIFFRRHYNLPSVIFCGMDTRNRRWTQNDVDGTGNLDSRMFGFVSRKPGGKTGNECHIMAEYEPKQLAADIVDFVQNILVGQRSATLGGRT